jgi:hypothetical protein
MVIMSKIGEFGHILLGIGSCFMIIFGSSFLFVNLFNIDFFNIIAFLTSLNTTVAASTLGSNGWLVSGISTLISGLISFKGYYDLKNSMDKNDLIFIWGIFSVVLGTLGGTIGGGATITAGLVFLYLYFLPSYED